MTTTPTPIPPIVNQPDRVRVQVSDIALGVFFGLVLFSVVSVVFWWFLGNAIT